MDKLDALPSREKKSLGYTKRLILGRTACCQGHDHMKGIRHHEDNQIKDKRKHSLRDHK